MRKLYGPSRQCPAPLRSPLPRPLPPQRFVAPAPNTVLFLARLVISLRFAASFPCIRLALAPQQPAHPVALFCIDNFRQHLAPAIAREINRRLLPDLRAYIAKLHEVDERTKSAEAKKQHAARALVDAINSTPDGRRAEILDGFGSDRLRIHTRESGGPYYNFEIGYAGSIELKVNLTLEDALKIAPILATGTKDA